MHNVHCFTSATFSYLDRVRVLGSTIKRYHPDWHFTFCLSDIEPAGFIFDEDAEPVDGVVRVTDLPIDDVYSWMFEHDIVELCTAVKGVMLHKLLLEGAPKVIYLDPDIALFSPLTEVIELLDRHDVILTPHQLDPDLERSAIVDNEIASMRYGIYNLGFVAVANSSEGFRFAKWWRDRLLQFCFDDPSNGLFTDQKWCDHAPSFFPGTYILRHRGYNVASWNLSQRSLSIDAQGNIQAGPDPLKFFHFTKVNWVGEAMLERYARGRIEVFELMEWYRTQLARNSVDNLPERWWAFGQYANGRTIPKSHRIGFRNNFEVRTRYPNPFIVNGDELSHLEYWLESS